MSFYNGILNHDDTHGATPIILRGLPGVGFKPTKNNDFDLDNKKLTNVQSGDDENDVMTKQKIENYVSNKTQYLDGALPTKVTSNKAVIYSNTGSIHSNSLYLKDQYGQETIFHNEDQDDNQIRLYIPNLKNNDSFGGRLKSSIMVTSIDQTIEGKKIFHDIQVPTPTIDGHASNKAYVNNEISNAIDNFNYVEKSGDTMIGPLIVPKDNYPVQGNLNKVINYEATREIFLSRKESRPMNTELDMGGFSIDNIKDPINSDQAVNKKTLDNALNVKANTSDLNDYMKLDGSKVMTGTLNMNNNRITNLPSPHLSTEPATKDYVGSVTNHMGSLFLDRLGTNTILGNINLNKHKIINMIEPVDDLDSCNKWYVDKAIVKSSIKPNSIPDNVFKYLMNDTNEWSSEYNIKVHSFLDLSESPHSWNKRVLSITPLKDDGNNYRFRLGIQCFRLENNKEYTLVIELYNKDFETWKRQLTFVNGNGVWVENHHTQKFQHQYEENGDIYYSKTLIKFKKTNTSAPIFIYITYHFDDKGGGDMATYPSEFVNQVYILAYGIKGLSDHIIPEVYDKHEAYEIDKTKMKMLVDLDMNGKSILNIANLNNNIYGMVQKFGAFSVSSFVISLKNVLINSVSLAPTSSYKSTQDEITFNTEGLEDSIIIKFNYSDNAALTNINIEHRFNNIRAIRLKRGRNFPFKLSYTL